MMVDAGEQLRVAADVVALLMVGEAAAHHDVVRLGEIDPRVTLNQCAQRNRGEVVGPDVLQRPLDRAPDGRPDGVVDDDRFRHEHFLLGATRVGWVEPQKSGRAARPHVGRRQE
jgi:hypothetical protein